jgi:hypothetical protein
MRIAALILSGMVAAGAQTAVSPAAAQASYRICRGEFEGPCKLHPYDRFERCGTYGVGGANPNLSCQALCGKPVGPGCQVSGNIPSMPGNACGYSWFIITCIPVARRQQ